MGRRFKYHKPDPVFKGFVKLLFSHYQILHHLNKWSECPTSLRLKIDAIPSNIHLPASSKSLASDLLEISSDFCKVLFEKCNEHLSTAFWTSHRNIELSLRQINFKDKSKIFSALIIVKRWARRSYRHLEDSFLTDICNSINEYHPGGAYFEYQNNRFLDKTPPSSLNHTLDSDDPDSSIETASLDSKHSEVVHPSCHLPSLRPKFPHAKPKGKPTSTSTPRTKIIGASPAQQTQPSDSCLRDSHGCLPYNSTDSGLGSPSLFHSDYLIDFITITTQKDND